MTTSSGLCFLLVFVAANSLALAIRNVVSSPIFDRLMKDMEARAASEKKQAVEAEALAKIQQAAALAMQSESKPGADTKASPPADATSTATTSGEAPPVETAEVLIKIMKTAAAAGAPPGETAEVLKKIMKTAAAAGPAPAVVMDKTSVGGSTPSGEGLDDPSIACSTMCRKENGHIRASNMNHGCSPCELDNPDGTLSMDPPRYGNNSVVKIPWGKTCTLCIVAQEWNAARLLEEVHAKEFKEQNAQRRETEQPGRGLKMQKMDSSDLTMTAAMTLESTMTLESAMTAEKGAKTNRELLESTISRGEMSAEEVQRAWDENAEGARGELNFAAK